MTTEQPIPLLFSGNAGDYFGTEYDGLPTTVHPDVQTTSQQLSEQGLCYLGKLNCSQFSQVDVYAYATADQRIAVSVMATDAGLGGIDCVCKFGDGTFLTTTTTQVLEGAYDEQRLFRVSFPNLNAADLLAQHQVQMEDFDQNCGAAQALFEDLEAIAHLVDEYTLRQQANTGHGMLQFIRGFALEGMAQQMAVFQNEDDPDASDEEEFDEDAVEYDLEAVSPLIRAILEEDIDQVRALATDTDTLNPSDWQSNVPLVVAVHKGHIFIIQALIDAGADPNKFDCDMDNCPLSMAIKQQRMDLIELLLDAGASPEGGDMVDTGLAIAVRKNNMPIFKMLLDAGADPNAGMEDDYRVIMAAAFYGRLDMVKRLVEHGADVSAWSQGETAIMRAASNAHQAVYDYLYPLIDGETRRYADKYGPTEIERAIKRQAREANKKGEKLGDAALFGKLETVKALLNEAVDPNILNSGGKSPLMKAAMYGHKAVIEALLESGANPNLAGEEKSEEGMTALMYIASSFFASNRAEVIHLLVKRGADVNLQNQEGETALMMADSNTDSVKALIDANADLDIRDNDGNTAMMLGTFAVQKLLRKAGASEEGIDDVTLVEAARQGDLAKVEDSLKKGANVNYLDGAALVEAVRKKRLDVIERLIEVGADVNLGGKKGFTPVAEAAYDGDLTIVDRLLAAGADPFQQTHNGTSGWNALNYAKEGELRSHKQGEHTAIVERFEQLKRQRERDGVSGT